SSRKPKPPKPPDANDILVMRVVYHHLKNARRWVFHSEAAVSRAQDYLRGVGTSFFAEQAKDKYLMCDKYFKLRGLRTIAALASLDFIRSILVNMRVCIGHQLDLDPERQWAVGWFQVDPSRNNRPDADAVMYTHRGGFTRREHGLPPHFNDPASYSYG